MSDNDSAAVQLTAKTITGTSYDVGAYLRGEDLESGQKAESINSGAIPSALKGGMGDCLCVVPPYHFETLALFAEDSPTLDPCISAMEINVDGTGHEVVPVDAGEFEKEEDYVEDAEYQAVVELFREPYPNTTMTALRRAIRRDLEQVGNAYIEILSNPADEIIFLKRADAKYVSLVAYDEDDKVEADLEISRGGSIRSMKVTRRERRFKYAKGSVIRFMSEFGSTRDLNKDSGKWGKAGNRLKAPDRSTKVIHLKVKDDLNGCYGVPRWISQVRSVAGEIEAEVLNLTYFKNGGIPPIMIFLQNGKITEGSKLQLDAALQGQAKDKNRGVVVETVPTSGSLDKAGNVNVKVERFGSDRQSDSMFGQYTDKCYTKVKSSYRIPQLFLGRTDDYNYATAYASIVVGEAQVFKPERDEFDDLINNTIVRTLTTRFKFQSKPLVAVDSEVQKSILDMVSNKGAVSNEELVRVANNLSNLNMQWNGKEQPDPTELLAGLNINGTNTPNPSTPATTSNTSGSNEVTDNTEATKSETGIDHKYLDFLAETWTGILRGDAAKVENLSELQADLKQLSPVECNMLEWKLAEQMMPDTDVNQTIVSLNAAAAKLNLEG